MTPSRTAARTSRRIDGWCRGPVAALALVLVASAPARAEQQGLEAWARSLVAQIMARQTSGDQLGDAWRVALWPLVDPPVEPKVAQSLERDLVRALDQAAANQVRLVDARRLEAIVAKLEEQPEHRDGIANPVAALRATAPIDVLILPRLEPVRDGERVVAEAVLLNDSSVVASAEAPVEVASEAGGCAGSYTTLAGALGRSAETFVRYLPEGATVHLCGITAEASRAVSELSDWLDGKLRGALAQAYARARPGRMLPFALDSGGCGAWRGAAAPPEDYYLYGSYWVLRDSIDLSLELRDAAGGSHIEPACLQLGAIDPGIDLEPRGRIPASLRENRKLGTIDFRLDSDRGADPHYKVGEEMRLFMELSEPAWIWCFYRDALGATYTLLPYDAAGRGLQLAAEVRHEIPGTFVVQEPIGTELLKCFASREDVGPQLPAAVRDSLPPAPGEPVRRPLPVEHATSFPDLFRSLAADLTEASLVVSVVPRSPPP